MRGIFFLIQFYYRSTSRELRRLDSVARSPIYSSLKETLDGSATRSLRKRALSCWKLWSSFMFSCDYSSESKLHRNSLLYGSIHKECVLYQQTFGADSEFKAFFTPPSIVPTIIWKIAINLFYLIEYNVLVVFDIEKRPYILSKQLSFSWLTGHILCISCEM